MTRLVNDHGLPNGRKRHNLYLERLVSRLDGVGENRSNIQWIMRDGIWMPQHSYERNKLCDIICVYYDHHASCIELKGSPMNEQKAMEQVAYGALFAQMCLGISDVVCKVVYYNDGKYNWKEFKRDQLPVVELKRA